MTTIRAALRRHHDRQGHVLSSHRLLAGDDPLVVSASVAALA